VFELDYRINIATADGISAVRSATDSVILAAELRRSGLETRKVFVCLVLKVRLERRTTILF